MTEDFMDSKTTGRLIQSRNNSSNDSKQKLKSGKKCEMFYFSSFFALGKKSFFSYFKLEMKSDV